MIDFLLFLALGRLAIFLVRKFPLAVALGGEGKFLRSLITCDLCLGFWVYLVLSFFYTIDINIIANEYAQYITIAGISTFVSYLISVGFSEVFMTVVIEDASNER